MQTTMTTARARWADRRDARRRHRRLAAELAGYRSPAERAELLEIAARSSDDQATELRALLPV